MNIVYILFIRVHHIHMSSCAIKVMARFRPLSPKEKDMINTNSSTFDITFEDEKSMVITNQSVPNPFAFDKVFTCNASQVFFHT